MNAVVPCAHSAALQSNHNKVHQRVCNQHGLKLSARADEMAGLAAICARMAILIFMAENYMSSSLKTWHGEVEARDLML